MKTMLSLIFCLLPFIGSGFVFNSDPLATADPQGSNDVQYLHLLLADEKTERMRLQNEVDQLKTSMQNIQEQLELSSQGTQTTTKCPYTAFRTQLTHDIGNVHTGHLIVFDRVDLNIGNGFDPRHGIFTAPCNGTYLFSITLGNVAKSGNIHLKKNGNTIEFAFAGYNSGWDMGGVSTVAELVAGDDVWVEGEGYIGGSISSTHLHTGYSGSLLHAL
ncbi:collagen alpha-1(X) chain-like [Mercenaria mercenaria]|uniref:collagen alpha-1(X) chain-like n=1 Tax=Mercenaria mercenaria TaxID=6596 RepID=UPI00234EDE7C|nr:collagen alpha-1(X) chain-like [Mercenaria mercenaria]